MEHSKYYEITKEHYDNGDWSEKRLRTLVKIGRITSDEFTDITGKVY